MRKIKTKMKFSTFNFQLSIIIAAIMILAASCGDGQPQPQPQPQSQSQSQSKTAEESPSPTLQIGHATDQVINKSDELYEYNDSDYGEKIVIRTDGIQKNLDFISIGFESRDGQTVLFAEDILYSINELSPEKVLVIKTLISEGIPSRGVSFLDANNIKRYFYIIESGIDGSLSLIEFQNNK